MSDHETIVISALRYALPRRSYIMSMTEEYIENMLKTGVSPQFLHVAVEDIKDHLNSMGDKPDALQHNWNPLLQKLLTQPVD